MERSEDIKELTKSLLRAQIEIEGAVKGNANAFFKSKYSDFNSVKEACKDKLNKNGILVIQLLDSDEHGQYVVTQLIHSDTGQFISSKTNLNIDPKDDIQKIMSKTTYCKRYALQTITFLGSVDDDDGESAVGRTQQKPATVVPAPQRGFGRQAPQTVGGTEWNN